MKSGKGRYFENTGVVNVLDYMAMAVSIGEVDARINSKGDNAYVSTNETSRDI